MAKRTVQELAGKVTLEGAPAYIRHLQQMGAATERFAAATAASGVAMAGSFAVTSVVALGAAFAGLVGLSVQRAATFESLRLGLDSVTGSAEESARQIERLRELAKSPGLGFREAIEGTVRLQSAGISAQVAEKALGGFGNALAAVGKGKAELQGVILALSQIQSKGIVSAEEINQLAERVPQIRRIMQAAFGTSNTEVLQKWGITSEVFINRVVDALGTLPKALGGAQNAWDNAMDAIDIGLVVGGTGVMNVLVAPLQKLTDVLSHLAADGTLRKMGEDIGRIITPAINTFQEALESIQTGGFARWLAEQAIGLAGFTAALSGVIAGFAILLRSIPLAVAAATLGLGAWKMNEFAKGLKASAAQAEGEANIKAAYGPISQLLYPQQNKGPQVGADPATQFLSTIAEQTRKTADNTSAMDRIARAIFGGGSLGRLGITPVEMAGFRAGGGSGSSIVINVNGGNPADLTNQILGLKRRGLI